MTTVTLKIWDEANELMMEANLDNPDAINEAPTAALIFGSYLGANTAAIVEDAMRWYKQRSPLHRLRFTCRGTRRSSYEQMD